MSYKLPQNAIPFDWEKYKSGKFEAITRGGYKPKQVYNLEGADKPICYVLEQRTISCQSSGKWLLAENSEDNYKDLFLRPKTVKKWHPVFKGMLCNSEHECLINWDVPNNSLVKAVEVEVNEE